jgi:hypothetical protein
MASKRAIVFSCGDQLMRCSLIGDATAVLMVAFRSIAER